MQARVWKPRNQPLSLEITAVHSLFIAWLAGPQGVNAHPAQVANLYQCDLHSKKQLATQGKEL